MSISRVEFIGFLEAKFKRFSANFVREDGKSVNGWLRTLAPIKIVRDVDFTILQTILWKRFLTKLFDNLVTGITITSCCYNDIIKFYTTIKINIFIQKTGIEFEFNVLILKLFSNERSFYLLRWFPKEQPDENSLFQLWLK